MRQYACQINRYASISAVAAEPAAATLERKLVVLARQILSKDAGLDAISGDIEAAKRTKQLEGLRDALRLWQENSNVM